ncbi:MAG TPA: acetyl-CoA carboxylase biotin carboxylase subunit [Chloroflexi bacterium]|nr:acetyl-CoA carboxylase biotin carboxylase subunit [Chloroflexota bacterium]
MFKKVLIANRGEIAVRIIRACQELGLGTVAVFSESDRHAMHVYYADEAYLIGKAQAKESYLNIDKILQVAKMSSVDAIHPGYGFLAENHEFARECINAGFIFIGPSPKSIASMGDKIVARNIMRKAGIPVVPGTEEKGDLTDDEILAIAPSVGFPLMIKSAAGGGGKGMRLINNLDALQSGLSEARRESESAFGNGSVYLERFISGARHIEFQVLADQHGNIIHLGERECSIQRRHQKLLEEAPAITFSDDAHLREEMGRIACRVADSVDYVNAGTVEFLLDNEHNYYFLEMNTRLQVEHPVTEIVTGVDIVKEQIRIARNRKLSRRQDEIEMKGWAIECRVNAEDSYNGFIPSIGTINTHIVPTGPGVRVDTGAYPGYTISPYYDSMISKVICSGKTRGEALLRMRRALEEYRIVGVKTTIPFHQQLLNSHRFMAGQFNTSFVDDDFQMGGRSNLDDEIAAVFAVLAAHQYRQQATHVVQRGKRDASNWKWFSRWERMNR